MRLIYLSLFFCHFTGLSLFLTRNHQPRSRENHSKVVFLCLGFRADLCTGGRNMPQIQGRLMHRGQKHASDSGQTYARWAETCPRFRADFYTGGRNMPQIQGRLMHRVQRRARDLGLILPQWVMTYIQMDTIKLMF